MKMDLSSNEIIMHFLVEHFYDLNGGYGDRVYSTEKNLQNIFIQKTTAETYVDLVTGEFLHIKQFGSDGYPIFDNNNPKIPEYEYWKNTPLSSFNIQNNSTVFYDILLPMFQNIINKMNSQGVFDNIY